MKTFGLVGKSLSHSFSKPYFEKKFEEESINDQYLNFELQSIDELPDLLKQNPDIFGLNITIPYKQQVIRFLDEIDREARIIGAVNTIKIDRSSSKIHLTGYNTDAKGFELTLKPYLKEQHKKALILGTGGASKAVEFVLRKYGISVREVSRHPLKSVQMSYGLINKQIVEEYLIIVNTTPLGMYPNENSSPEIPYEFLGDDHLLIDLIYNPAETLFLKKGKEKGAKILNGIQMLHSQADQSWRIWKG